MTYHDAIKHLTQVLGRCEPGPRPGEISFFYHQGDAEATIVWDEAKVDVIKIAEISMQAHLRNNPLYNGGHNNCVC